MHRVSRKMTILTVGLVGMYVLGYFLLFPLFSHFIAGSSYHRFVARPARSIHEAVYAPTIRVLGPDSAYTRLWVANANWWCKSQHGESCVTE